MSTTTVSVTAPKTHPPAVVPGYLHHGDSALVNDLDGGITGAYELHSISAQRSERTRRFSVISRPSNATLSITNNSRDAALITQIQRNAPNTSNAELSLKSLSEDKRFKRKGLVHFAALCWCIFLAGWNDGSTGPLLPIFQSNYRVDFSIVSLYFVSNCVGFMVAAGLNVWLNDKIGFGKIIVIGAIFQLTAYAIQAPGPPFPAIVFANGLAGFGMSLQNAQANGYVGSLKEHMSTKLGLMHAAYGFGGFVSPFVATYFSGTRRWSFHYLVSAVMAVVNTAALVLVFRLKPLDELLANAGQAPEEQVTSNDSSKFRQIIRLRTLHILAVWALIYIGIEVTMGGWIVTYIIHERGGGHGAGYISSGFWGGLTLGRIGLMWFNKLVGERRVIFLYSVITIGLEITVWFVPSILGNAVAVSFIGLMLGPMFPVLVSHTTKVLPRWLVTVCLGWITGIGIAGSAALPFLTGLLASKFGIGSLQPLLVSMMCMMLVVWAFVPRAVLRVD